MQTHKQRGRPPALSDDALLQRRADLLTTFDWPWTDFAWQLQRAKTTKAIRKALHPIRDARGMSLFTEVPEGNSSWIELRNIRKCVHNPTKQLAIVTGENEASRQRLERVEGAIRDVGEDEQLARASEQYRHIHASTARVFLGLEGSLVEAHRELHWREASVCQSEMLDFITSKRYTITPLSLANAVSGVPFITWRCSVGRCIRLGDAPCVSLSYQMFMELKRACTHAPRAASKAVEQVKAYLIKDRKLIPPAIREFRHDWYYLRRAIESAYEKNLRKDMLPYIVHAEYRRKTSSRSRLDQVLEELERL